MKYLYVSIIVLLIFFLYGGMGIFKYQYDDSYITYRYAENLANGHGLIFNQGERVDAASSFLFTVIISVLHKIGLNPQLSSIILSLLSLAIIALLIINTNERV